MSVLVFAALLLGAGPAATTPPEAAAGKALLEKAIEAAGGARELATIQDVTSTGTLTATLGDQDAEGTVTVIETREGTTRDQMTLGGFEMVSVVGPSGGFTSQAGIAKPLTGNDLLQAQAQARFTVLGLLLHGFEPGVALRALPQEDGLDVLEVRPSGADPLTFYFDPVTHLVTRLKAVNAADGSTLVSRYSLYKPVAGVQMPHHVSIAQAGLQMSFTFTRIQVNAGIAPGLLPNETTRRSARASTAEAASTPPATAPETVTISIVNRSEKILNELHLSPQGRKDWGANLLPVDRFHDGDTVKVPFGRGSECLFDLMVADTDGRYSVLPGADLCKHQALTIRLGKRGVLLLKEK